MICGLNTFLYIMFYCTNLRYPYWFLHAIFILHKCAIVIWSSMYMKYLCICIVIIWCMISRLPWWLMHMHMFETSIVRMSLLSFFSPVSLPAADISYFQANYKMLSTLYIICLQNYLLNNTSGTIIIIIICIIATYLTTL